VSLSSVLLALDFVEGIRPFDCLVKGGGVALSMPVQLALALT